MNINKGNLTPKTSAIVANASGGKWTNQHLFFIIFGVSTTNLGLFYIASCVSGFGDGVSSRDLAEFCGKENMFSTS